MPQGSRGFKRVTDMVDGNRLTMFCKDVVNVL